MPNILTIVQCDNFHKGGIYEVSWGPEEAVIHQQVDFFTFTLD